MENEKAKSPKPLPCPKWLENAAKTEWRRVAKLLTEEGREFTQKDTKALEAYCINYAKWKKCEEIIAKEGFTMEVGDNGYVQQRPEISIANKAQTEMRAWSKELGLTPAARQRMKTQNAGEGYDEEMDGLIAHD